jgi:hypothetical protein
MFTPHPDLLPQGEKEINRVSSLKALSLEGRGLGEGD